MYRYNVVFVQRQWWPVLELCGLAIYPRLAGRGRKTAAGRAGRAGQEACEISHGWEGGRSAKTDETNAAVGCYATNLQCKIDGGFK